jgi:predicted dehydrogenase
VQSAQEAIKLYELPQETKAYGDPEALAADPDVDLVVCSVRVDRHLLTIAPSLKAGKDVFVEWPLGKSAAEARTLLQMKNEGGVKKAVVGLQARLAPSVATLKKLVDEGRVGKVLSSSWAASAGTLGESSSEGYEYLGRKEVGGNIVTIHFGHSIDYLQYGISSFHCISKTTLSHETNKSSQSWDTASPQATRSSPTAAPPTNS